jgi:ABC-type uncharacterized transport system permease subunit
VSASGYPLSSERDWYLVAAWVLAGVYLYLMCFRPRAPFGVLILPLVLGLIGAGVFLADPKPFDRAPAMMGWGIVHGASIVLASVAVLVGFVTGLMYLGQARRLKRKLPPPHGLWLPSLEWLRRVNSRAIVVSILMLGLGILSGVMLNAITYGRQVGRVPWNDPVVLSTTVMFAWLVISAGAVLLYRPAREGKKVAYLTVISFIFLVVALGAGLLLDTRHWQVRPENATPPAAGHPASAGTAQLL